MHFGRLPGTVAAILSAAGVCLALGAGSVPAEAAASAQNPPQPLFEMTTSAGYFYTLNPREEWSAESQFGFKLQPANRGYLRGAPFPDSAAVYRFKLKDRPGYLLVADPHERDSLVASGYVLEGVLGYEAATQHPGTVAWHRYHSSRGDWRVAPASEDAAIEAQGYILDGTLGWVWPSAPVPLHEMKTPEAYFYTAYAPEASSAAAVYKFQPVNRNVGLLSPVAFPGSAPVYRFKVKDRPRYLLVTSPQEHDSLIAAGYTLEGVAGYDSAVPQAGMAPWFRFHSSRADWRVSLSSDDPELVQQGYVLDGPLGYTWAAPPSVPEVSPAATKPAAAPAAPAPAQASAAPLAAPAAAPSDAPAQLAVQPARHAPVKLDANPSASVLSLAAGVDRRVPLALLGLAMVAGAALVLVPVIASRRRRPRPGGVWK